jgi:hypothetical protein
MRLLQAVAPELLGPGTATLNQKSQNGNKNNSSNNSNQNDTVHKNSLSLFSGASIDFDLSRTR